VGIGFTAIQRVTFLSKSTFSVYLDSLNDISVTSEVMVMADSKMILSSVGLTSQVLWSKDADLSLKDKSSKVA
jgi:hypothetical protein